MRVTLRLWHTRGDPMRLGGHARSESRARPDPARDDATATATARGWPISARRVTSPTDPTVVIIRNEPSPADIRPRHHHALRSAASRPPNSAPRPSSTVTRCRLCHPRRGGRFPGEATRRCVCCWVAPTTTCPPPSSTALLDPRSGPAQAGRTATLTGAPAGPQAPCTCCTPRATPCRRGAAGTDHLGRRRGRDVLRPARHRPRRDGGPAGRRSASPEPVSREEFLRAVDVASRRRPATVAVVTVSLPHLPALGGFAGRRCQRGRGGDQSCPGLLTTLRPDDVLARLGPQECVSCPAGRRTPGAAAALGRRVDDALRGPVPYLETSCRRGGCGGGAGSGHRRGGGPPSRGPTRAVPSP